jgi:hypothetical protein
MNKRLLQSTRIIRNTPIVRLDQSNLGSSSGSGTDHSHFNKPLLDSLRLDSKNRLIVNNALVNPPLIDEEW